MFLPPQQVIVCDHCSYDETFELHEICDHEWQLDVMDLEKAGWKVIDTDVCYCVDCKEDMDEE